MIRMRPILGFACVVPFTALLGCGTDSAPAVSDGFAGAPPTAMGGAVSAGGASSVAGQHAGGAPAVAGGGSGGSLAAAGRSSGSAGEPGSGGASGGASNGGSAGSSPASGGSAPSATCLGGACLNPDCKPYTTAAAIDAYPETGFDPKPSYIPNDVIIPTLDDVPDDIVSPPNQAKGAGDWTTSDLKYLDEHNMHWDLFINTNNACDFSGKAPAACQAAVVDITKNHYPGNHTVHHFHLGMTGSEGCPDATCVANEIKGVETVVSAASNGAHPYLTRFRAPFGEPFQDQGTGYAIVAPVVAQYAVQIGWNLDSDDSNHDDGVNCTPKGKCPTGQTIAATVEKLIKTPGTGSAYGILLMHGIFGWTRDAIPLLFDPATGYLAKNKFRVGTVEDAVCWKYGKHSWEIVQAKTNKPHGPN